MASSIMLPWLNRTSKRTREGGVVMPLLQTQQGDSVGNKGTFTEAVRGGGGMNAPFTRAV